MHLVQVYTIPGEPCQVGHSLEYQTESKCPYEQSYTEYIIIIIIYIDPDIYVFVIYIVMED